MSSVSIIIPTFNKAPYLALTLASYSGQTDSDFEIVIVDDGSSDETPSLVAGWAGRLPIRYHRRDNGGRAAARNEGLRRAEGDIVIFSDDDRIVDPRFVAAHKQAQAEREAQVMGWQRAIVSLWRDDLPLDPLLFWRGLSRAQIPLPASSGGPVPLFSTDDLEQRFARTVERFSFDERWWEEGCMPIIRRYGDDLAGFRAPWMLGTTGNLSVPRKAALEVGLFDDSFRGWGLEDLELCYRLHHAGLPTHVSRGAINFHQAHPVARGKRLQWLENLLRFLDKFDAMDAALYGYCFTRYAVVDMNEFNQQLDAIERDPVKPALHAALVQATRALVAARIRALGWSAGVRIVGQDHDEW